MRARFLSMPAQPFASTQITAPSSTSICTVSLPHPCGLGAPIPRCSAKVTWRADAGWAAKPRTTSSAADPVTIETQCASKCGSRSTHRYSLQGSGIYRSMRSAVATCNLIDSGTPARVGGAGAPLSVRLPSWSAAWGAELVDLERRERDRLQRIPPQPGVQPQVALALDHGVLELDGDVVADT